MLNNTPKRLSEATSMAITSVLSTEPFYGARLMPITIIESDKIPTAATNCIDTIWVNPDFAKKIYEDEVTGKRYPGAVAALLVHEIEHIARLHGPLRISNVVTDDGFYSKLWNAATDYIINKSLEVQKFDIKSLVERCMQNPANPPALPNTGLKIADFISLLNGSQQPDLSMCGAFYDTSLPLTMSAEELYRKFVEEFEKNPNKDNLKNNLPLGGGMGQDMQAGSGDQDADSDPNDPTVPHDFKTALDQKGMTPDQAAADINSSNQQAAQAAENRQRGSTPGFIDGLIDEMKASFVDWRAKLRRFVSAVARDDYSYRRPSRRSPTGLILPSLYSEKVGPVAVVVDESGSVSDDELSQALGELAAICARVKPESVSVITCDTRVTGVTKYRSNQVPKTMQVGGRGGTDMTPAFELVKETIKRPSVLICFTDGELSCPPKPSCPVLWVICRSQNENYKFVPAYGTVVEVRL